MSNCVHTSMTQLRVPCRGVTFSGKQPTTKHSSKKKSTQLETGRSTRSYRVTITPMLLAMLGTQQSQPERVIRYLVSGVGADSRRFLTDCEGIFFIKVPRPPRAGAADGSGRLDTSSPCSVLTDSPCSSHTTAFTSVRSHPTSDGTYRGTTVLR